MTTEELVAAGLLAEPEVRELGTARRLEGRSSPAASGSGTHEDGEIRSEEEEIGDVDADVCSKAVGTSSSILCFWGIQGYNQYDQRVRGC
jgi:hypothetical protein